MPLTFWEVKACTQDLFQPDQAALAFQQAFDRALVAPENPEKSIVAALKTAGYCSEQYENLFFHIFYLALQKPTVYDYFKTWLTSGISPSSHFEQTLWTGLMERIYGKRITLPQVNPFDFCLGRWITEQIKYPFDSDAQQLNALSLLLHFTHLGALAAFQRLCEFMCLIAQKASRVTNILSLRETFQQHYRSTDAENLYGAFALMMYQTFEETCQKKLHAIQARIGTDKKIQHALREIKDHLAILETRLQSASSGICTQEELLAVAQQKYAVSPTPCHVTAAFSPLPS